MIVYKDPFPGLRGDGLGNLAPYRNGKPHRGCDWHPTENSVIPAITDGKVVKIFWSDVLGHCVVQSTLDKNFVLYAHLAKKPSSIKVGSPILMGQPVGRVGGGPNTPSGSASTGAHLHVAMCLESAGADVHLVPFESLRDVFKIIDTNKGATK
jgi:murein DD-endopeptidase MepM/ murein hydrolase activator NlpD